MLQPVLLSYDVPYVLLEAILPQRQVANFWPNHLLMVMQCLLESQSLSAFPLWLLMEPLQPKIDGTELGGPRTWCTHLMVPRFGPRPL